MSMIRQLPGVREVVLDQCEFGLSVKEGTLSKKATRLMTNDPPSFVGFQDISARVATSTISSREGT